MGTIYQKILSGNANGYDQCLVLENREALLYPLADEIKDWNELRIGLTLSLTDASGDGLNERCKVFKESIANTSKYTSYYIGLKSNNDLMPNSPGCSFIGLGAKTGQTISLNISSVSWAVLHALNGIGSIDYLMASGDSIFFTTGFSIASDPTSTTNYGILSSPDKMYGSGAPLTHSCIRLLRVSGNGINIKVKKQIINYNTPESTNNNSISGLRNFMNNFFELPTLTLQTRYNGEYVVPFTSDLTMNGTPIPAPDALFLYWPFSQTKLRVHNFCIEKYS